MINLIIAIDKKGGIGFQNKLPWNFPQEIQIFKKKTLDNIVVMGKTTHDSLPRQLKNRDMFIVSSRNQLDACIQDSLNRSNKTGQIIWVAGGKYVYEKVLNDYDINEIHISILKDTYTCDTFIDTKLLFRHCIIREKIEYESFIHYVLSCDKKYSSHCDKQYTHLLDNVMTNGNVRETRNSIVKSIFCQHMSFDLNCGFPLLTTKKMFWKGIVEEFIFFVKGETDSKLLERKGINIWKGNTNKNFLDKLYFYERPEGIMGPMYGYQWRFYGAKYDEMTGKPVNSLDGVDQLVNVINDIKTNPTSRRIMLTDFNPAQVNEGVLPPCHSIIVQFYVDSDKLDMFCYNRSSDLFLGLPFNIASSALLLHLVAKLTGLKVNRLHLSLGDAHIYENHYSSVMEQMSPCRQPYKLPTLDISLPDGEVTNVLNQLSSEHFILGGYTYHESIKSKMII